MVLAITGITGSGKHDVADYFKKRQWVILDSNKLMDHLYRPYTHVWKGLVDHFGEKILNQNDRINHHRLNQILFSTTEPNIALSHQKVVNELMYPALTREIKERIHRHYRRKSNIIVIAAAWESLKLHDVTDKVLLLQVKFEIAFERAKIKNALTKEMFEVCIAHQREPIYADYKLDSNGSAEDLKVGLNMLYQEIQQLESYYHHGN